MNPWIIILFVTAAAVFAVDFLLRRKGWSANSKGEKISLLIHMFSIGPYIFFSALGMLWGIASGTPDSAFTRVVYDVTLSMGSTYFVVAAVAAILSFFFRKKGKIKASIWTNVIALLYIVVVLAVNYLVGELL